ncbi:hypothetical protein EJ06DRAFT_240617 [Trichodelitschia bisporula]|uniref:Elongation of fatty acids protein n=1 Tax=Trichodelitschia bisporula TaxID=703511 RepID=A0A6G1HK66_9PEZI|nr:hypothetical protein EJ06DRAFT_240617 [Trichodelitschia bisporula]
MSGPSLTLRLPPRWLFAFPPDPVPLALPPPTDARTFASPFPIDAKLFNDALDWKVPVTIGAVYATTAIFMNRINRERGNKPWGFSKTAAFHYFVLAHNIFLAVFSALTFVGMIRALAHSWPGNRELYIIGKWWPGLRTQNGLAGAADALCKMHGPRGIGDATYYDPHTHTWLNKNPNVLLAANGAPENSDVGRLWNEGLAFWGWWFYLSKFYEVLDTFIILAKGKRSSTLQTYHHTGAMACMWAGIRYMSPPIWMFCFLNSGIHAMMYTYYTLSALRIKVPQRIKRTLTTMQISQFLIGMTFAGLHLFVHYTVPVSVPITVTETISSAISSASAAVASVASEASSAVAAGATAGLMDGLKKALFRAAGEEGLAENVGRRTREPALSRPSSIPGHQIRKQTHMHTAYQEIPCIDTQGQAFAVWLNLIYLAPLT